MTVSTIENRYGSLASRVYHLDKPIGRSFGDIEFYRERLMDCQKPVLEPAAGNGRMLIPLLEAGLEMYGFDASPEMVALCREECARRGLPTPVDVQTFEAFSYEQRFEAIILPAGSFQLIVDPTAALRVLDRFREALLPGGRLIIDLDLLSCLADVPGRARHWHDGRDFLTLQESSVERNFARQTMLSQLRYELWREGKLVSAQMELFHLRFWGLTEFELALRIAGFSEIAIFGDYGHAAGPEEAGRTITFEARVGGELIK